MNSLNQLCHPLVRIQAWDAAQRLVWSRLQPNTLTYAAADTMVQALVGNAAAQVRYLYARFSDSQTQPASWLGSGHTAQSATRMDFVRDDQTNEQNGAGLWVPLQAAPLITSTDANYSGNQVTYSFRIPAVLPGTQVEPSGRYSPNSYIYALGLAVSRQVNNRTADVIISLLQSVPRDAVTGDPLPGDFAPFAAPVGGQITVDYPLPFTA